MLQWSSATPTGNRLTSAPSHERSLLHRAVHVDVPSAECRLGRPCVAVMNSYTHVCSRFTVLRDAAVYTQRSNQYMNQYCIFFTCCIVCQRATLLVGVCLSTGTQLYCYSNSYWLLLASAIPYSLLYVLQRQRNIGNATSPKQKRRRCALYACARLLCCLRHISARESSRAHHKPHHASYHTDQVRLGRCTMLDGCTNAVASCGWANG